MRNQTSFRLTTTLLPTDMTAKTTQVINKVDENGDKFYPTFTEETIVLTNDDRTVMETARATASNGVLTFTKRGLSDDVSETQVANRKLTWNPGSLVFITAGAADWIDKDDSVTWTGDQTYTGELTSTNKATYKGQLITEKGVKYPNFADVTALQAYADPFAGMFATVDDTGELYRYNANTCCWDMVSTVALGTYEIRVEDNAPAPGTAETIVTITKPAGEIYVGNCRVAERAYFADILAVGGGGAPSSHSQYCTGGGGGGGMVECIYTLVNNKSVCVKVGANGTVCGQNGGNSSFGGIVAFGGGGAGSGCLGGSGGGGVYNVGGTGLGILPQGYDGGNNGASCTGSCYGAGGGGGGAGGPGGNAASYCNGGAGGPGRYSIIMGCFYGAGGRGGSGCYNDPRPNGYGWGNCGSGGAGGGKNVGKSDGTCGIVAVRYPTDGSYGIHCATGGDCVYTCDGYKIHCFVTDGTFTIVN